MVFPRIANQIIISSLSGSVAVIIAAIANSYTNTATEKELTQLRQDLNAQAATSQTVLDTIEKSEK